MEMCKNVGKTLSSPRSMLDTVVVRNRVWSVKRHGLKHGQMSAGDQETAELHPCSNAASLGHDQTENHALKLECYHHVATPYCPYALQLM